MAMAALSYVTTQEAARLKFEAVAIDALNRIDARVGSSLSLLQSAKAFADASGGNLTEAKFATFFKALNLEPGFSGLSGLGYLPLIKPGEEAAVETRIQGDFGIDRRLYPDSTLEWRTPITLFEPRPDLRAIGYDMYTDEVRRRAIDMALASNDARATGKVLLGAPTGSEQVYPGFLVFAKLNPDSARVTIPSADASRPAGLIYASFRSEQLFTTALQRIPLLPVSIEVFDGEPVKDNLLYRSLTVPDESLDRFKSTRQTVVAGRSWTIVFHPTSAFAPPLSLAVPFAIGFFGLLLGTTIALAARYQERAFDAVTQLHEATEKSLADKDLMLQEMKHRIKNSIARVLAMARQTAAHAKGIDEFSASFSARLQAMAASQDMLTRSRWQKADLGELLRIELGQVFGKEIPEGMLKGPPVELDETTTQALGLTFHELATNALKYGEAANSVGVLNVEWSLSGGRKDKRLRLNWSERSGKPVKKPEKIGFGTKLIDMNITRELDGTIERVYEANGIKIAIDIPYRT